MPECEGQDLGLVDALQCNIITSPVRRPQNTFPGGPLEADAAEPTVQKDASESREADVE